MHPIKFTYAMENGVNVPAGGTQTSIGVDFGITPVMCDVSVRIQGCIELNAGSGDTEAIGNVEDGVSGVVLRRTCNFVPAAAYLSARPTLAAELHKLTQLSDRIFYRMSFYTSGRSTRFLGASDAMGDTDGWYISVEIH